MVHATVHTCKKDNDSKFSIEVLSIQDDMYIYIYVSLTLKTTDHFLHRPVAYADSVAQDQPSHPCSQTRELDCPLKSG